MKTLVWLLLLALLIGIGLGLVYSWLISPVRVVDSEPIALRADFKDQYRSVISAAYSGTGNLERAKVRLALLGDQNSVEALNAQAQRLMAGGDFQNADHLAVLSAALLGMVDVVNPAPSQISQPDPKIVPTQIIESPTKISTAQIIPTETPEFIATEIVVIASTPRPTRTLVPTQGASFKLIVQESICDSNLPDGLLQILVMNSRRKQLAGIEIRVTWDAGNDQFFTGLKPELGNGYADFLMTPNTAYTVQLAKGSDISSGLFTQVCQTPSGESFLGGYKLTFQQP